MSKVKWTEVEDFFIRENVMKYNDKELAEKLGKSEKQVIAHIKALGIDINKLLKAEKRKNALKGLQVGSSNDPNANIVAMTGARSMADDIAAKGKKGTTAFRIEEIEKELAELKDSEKKVIEAKPNKLYDQFRVEQ